MNKYWMRVLYVGSFEDSFTVYGGALQFGQFDSALYRISSSKTSTEYPLLKANSSRRFLITTAIIESSSTNATLKT
jgi:hypothetical protein